MTRLLALALLAIGALACTYNWTEGPREAGADSGGVDAFVGDVRTGDTSVGDASGSDAGAGMETTGDANPMCTALSNEISLDLAGMLACQSQCLQSVSDQCDCAVAVEDAGSPAVKKFVSDVASFKDAGCTADCSGCHTPAFLCFAIDGGGVCI